VIGDDVRHHAIDRGADVDAVDLDVREDVVVGFADLDREPGRGELPGRAPRADHVVSGHGLDRGDREVARVACEDGGLAGTREGGELAVGIAGVDVAVVVGADLVPVVVEEGDVVDVRELGAVVRRGHRGVGRGGGRRDRLRAIARGIEHVVERRAGLAADLAGEATGGIVGVDVLPAIETRVVLDELRADLAVGVERDVPLEVRGRRAGGAAAAVDGAPEDVVLERALLVDRGRERELGDRAACVA
jgi:hypothetical protein